MTGWGFPSSLAGKESACNAGDLGWIPGLGRSPGEGNGNPLQYSCLQNPHGQRSLAGYCLWGHQESDMTAQYSKWQDELSEGSQMSYSLLKILKWPLSTCRLGFIYLENKYTLNFKVAYLFLCLSVYFCLFWRVMKSSIPSVVSLALFSFAQLVCGMSIHIVACRYNSTMCIADAGLQFSYLCPYYWKVFGLF